MHTNDFQSNTIHVLISLLFWMDENRDHKLRLNTLHLTRVEFSYSYPAQPLENMRIIFLLVCLCYFEFVLSESDITFNAVSVDKPHSSVTTIRRVKSSIGCGMECLHKGECIAFTFSTLAVESCYLYRSISLDTNGTEVFALSSPVLLTQKKELG